MRKYIIEILRKIESDNLLSEGTGFEINSDHDFMYQDFVESMDEAKRDSMLKIDYDTYVDKDVGYHSIREFMFFPNFRYLYEKLNFYCVEKNMLCFSEVSLRHEINRMEAEGIIKIDKQISKKCILNYSSDFKPIYGTCWNSDTESIILLAKGGNVTKYLWYKLWDNPISAILSIIAIVVSIISLIK